MTAPAEIRRAANRAARDLLLVADSEKLDGRERDAIGLVRHVCHEIADGER